MADSRLATLPTMSPPSNGSICALTVDVEGFAESRVESVPVPSGLLGSQAADFEIAANLDVALELFEQHSCRATFFFLGRIARTAPDLVRRVVDHGHEIGCHSLEHLRITGQTQSVFRAALREAKSSLEDVSGQAVIGFRAPEFSIGTNNRWAFDELAQAGFRYDSSVMPTQVHDVYGMRGTEKGIFRWSNGLVEFPLPTVRFLGADWPVGGGGYFRLFPVRWTCRFYQSRQERADPVAFYIHPYEIGPHAPKIPGLSWLQQFRHYVRQAEGAVRLPPLLSSVAFTTMRDVLTNAGFLDQS
jgi:polysaccharide deacetylase family protein (PEP-CTERM system associated)